jgi:glycosyltransferase involved in cell wall biosynthesis
LGTSAYDAADVLVVPSLYEVWGLVVNEALAHGLPVIASDQVAAADHLITPGVTGEIFPAGDAAALRAAVAKLARWTERDYENCASVARPAAAAASHEHVATALIHAAELAVRQRAQRQ